MTEPVDLVCVVPVYNEEAVIGPAVRMLAEALQPLAHNPRIIIASNGCTDRTDIIARQLAAELAPVVELLVCAQRGRGMALQAAVRHVSAPRYMYVDVDLPLELSDLGPVLMALDDTADLVVCRRQGFRPTRRRLMTWSLRQLNRTLFGLRISDSQCAVKAMSPQAARVLTDDCRQNGWYLDTELIVLANLRGLNIREVPIRWIEQRFSDRRSKVKPTADVVAGLRALRAIWHRRLELSRRSLGARRG